MLGAGNSSAALGVGGRKEELRLKRTFPFLCWMKGQGRGIRMGSGVLGENPECPPLPSLEGTISPML